MKISYTPGKVLIQLSMDECTREHHFYPNNYKINKKPEKKKPYKIITFQAHLRTAVKDEINSKELKGF